MRTEHIRHHDRRFVIEARGFAIEDTYEAGLDFVQLWFQPQGAAEIEALHTALSEAQRQPDPLTTPELAAIVEAEAEALRHAVVASGIERPGQSIIIRAIP